MQEEPPFARIVATIRRRIETGELAPGDRVPSTRQITREWGVAMATATKVLTALRQEGLVTAKVGVGTVVACGAPVAGSAGAGRAAVAGDAAAVGGAARAGGRALAGGAGSGRAGSGRAGSGRAGAGDASRASGAAAASGQSTSEQSRVYAADVTTAHVLRTAIAIADAEGTAALSMRRVASELGVATMSLYRHVPSKDELFIQMVDVVMGDRRFVGSPPGDLRRGLELAGRTLWTVFRQHPWAAAALSLTRPRATPNALAYSEWVMRLLNEAGLDDHHVFQVHLTLFSYVRGMAVNLEWEAAAEAETGLTFDQFMDTQDDRFAAVVHSGGYPTVVELFARSDFDLNLDELFEFGLRHLLDGFAGLLR